MGTKAVILIGGPQKGINSQDDYVMFCAQDICKLYH